MSPALLVSYEENIQKILFNRPKRKNAISFEIYQNLVSALNAGAADPKVTLTVLSGVGSYYSSGTDFGSNVKDIDDDDGETALEKSANVLKKFVAAFIDYPKPLIAIVNGPAIGISVTTLALCDVVFAVDTATFHTPFTSLGLSPEGASSVTFPPLLGASLASEMLLLGRKLAAHEARGLVSAVYRGPDIEAVLWPKLREWAKLPPQSLMHAKELVRGPQRARLHEANEREVARLRERWQSEEFGQAMASFFNRRSKL